MRIFSKFHDYYDTALGHGFDPTIVYERHTEVIEEPTLIQKLKNKLWEPSDLNYGRHLTTFSFIGFCGKVYPLIPLYFSEEYGKKTALHAHNNHRDYPPEECIYQLDKMPEHFSDGRFGTHKIVFPKIVDFEEIFQELKVPVFFFSRTAVLYKNPSLKTFQFFKEKDAYTAFQDISMYMSNNLAIRDNPAQITDDKIKVASKGFDTKYGFRTRQKDKR